MEVSSSFRPQTNAPWASWRQNANNNGQSQYVGPVEPNAAWKFATAGTSQSETSQAYSAGITSTPVVGNDGRVYFSANDGYLYCVDQFGQQLWSFDLHFPGMSGLVVRNDNSVIVTTNYKLVYAISGAGKRLWMTVLNSSIHSAPMVQLDGTVYVGTDGNDFNAIDGNTGKIKWTRSLVGQDMAFIGSAAIGQDLNIYIGATQQVTTPQGKGFGYSYLLAIEPENGGIVYQKALPQALTASPVISETNVIYVSYGNNIDAIFMGNKSTWWSKKYGDSSNEFWSTMAIASTDNTLYVPSLDGNLYAVGGDDGSLQWKFKTGDSIDSSPVVDVNQNIYVSSNDGNLYAVDKAGKEVFKYQTNNADPYVRGHGFTYFSSSPIISNGALYVGSSDGTFHALAAPSDIAPPKAADSAAAGGQTTIVIVAVAGVLGMVALALITMKFWYGKVFFKGGADKNDKTINLQENQLRRSFIEIDFEAVAVSSSRRHLFTHSSEDNDDVTTIYSEYPANDHTEGKAPSHHSKMLLRSTPTNSDSNSSCSPTKTRRGSVSSSPAERSRSDSDYSSVAESRTAGSQFGGRKNSSPVKMSSGGTSLPTGGAIY